jgi:hypothetical protein
MNAHKANLINSVSLFVMSLWDYFGSMNPAVHSFVPLLFGVMLLSLNNGVLYNIKGQKRAAFVLTIFMTVLLLRPMYDAIGDKNTMVIIRIGWMMGTSLLAIIYFIKNVKK